MGNGGMEWDRYGCLKVSGFLQILAITLFILACCKQMVSLNHRRSRRHRLHRRLHHHLRRRLRLRLHHRLHRRLHRCHHLHRLLHRCLHHCLHRCLQEWHQQHHLHIAQTLLCLGVDLDLYRSE